MPNRKTMLAHGFDAFIRTSISGFKTTLELRPVYHRKEERIRAHVLLCWLSLLLVRIAEVNTLQTWPQLRSEMEDMHLIEYESTGGLVYQRTEITEAQKRILFLVTALVKKEQVQRFESKQFINRTFGGSLPQFITAFMKDKTLSEREADNLKKLIDSYKED